MGGSLFEEALAAGPRHFHVHAGLQGMSGHGGARLETGVQVPPQSGEAEGQSAEPDTCPEPLLGPFSPLPVVDFGVKLHERFPDLVRAGPRFGLVAPAIPDQVLQAPVGGTDHFQKVRQMPDIGAGKHLVRITQLLGCRLPRRPRVAAAEGFGDQRQVQDRIEETVARKGSVAYARFVQGLHAVGQFSDGEELQSVILRLQYAVETRPYVLFKEQVSRKSPLIELDIATQVLFKDSVIRDKLGLFL